MAYNIDETVDLGDPGHVTHHRTMAAAINDLDERIGGTRILFVNDLGEVPPGTPADTLVIVRG